MGEKKTQRDFEKTYTIKQTVKKMRRLADCLEGGKAFRIHQRTGCRITSERN